MGVFRRLFVPDVAIDLGTANTLVFVKGYGIVLSEPSVIAIDMKTDEVVAVGSAAKSMIGRTPAHIVATQPLKNGVIADFEVTEKMLAYFIRGARPKRSFLRYLVRPRVAVCVPSGVTGVELRAVKEATESAGARKAFTIEEPLAAAIGVNLPVSEPEGCMVVDVGGGTTEVAVISLGGIVTKTSVRVAGNDMDLAIASHIQKEYQIAIGTQTAEQLKIELGSAFPMPEEDAAEVRGLDLVTGLPVFVFRGSFYERFIGGFVNGNAMLTYLPAAAVGAQRTINGMIYAVRTEELRSMGGFAAIQGRLTDDYAMAQLYERNGKRVLQTAVCVWVGMTVRDAAHCGRVLRRWFVFANRYFRENAGIPMLLLISLIENTADLVRDWRRGHGRLGRAVPRHNT